MIYALFCEKCKLGSFCNEKIDLFTCDKCVNNQPDRLRRVDTSNSEAIVGSANIDEIAEANRNDLPTQ